MRFGVGIVIGVGVGVGVEAGSGHGVQGSRGGSGSGSGSGARVSGLSGSGGFLRFLRFPKGRRKGPHGFLNKFKKILGAFLNGRLS